MEKKSVIKKITGSREALLAIIVIVLFAVVTAISPSFLTPKSLMEMLKNNAVTMVMSLGMLCVMLVGGIDISIMSTLALTGMSIGMLLKYGHITSTLLAFIIAMAIGIACGLVVGLVISRANVPPIIATMGFMYIYRAMGYLVSHGGEWASAAALGDFKNFATTNFLGINKVIWVIIVCYVVFFFFMKWTRTGRRIYAVGSNASAAQVSGINAKNINSYLAFPKILACGGSWMVKGDLVEAGEFDKITELTREAVMTMLGFELKHIGINCENEEEAEKTAGTFASLFGFEKKSGNSSVFAGSAVEAMKSPYLGAKGHIAVGTNSVERAVNYLESQGVEFNMESAKYKDGRMTAIYLKEEVAGFAVHLVQK